MSYQELISAVRLLSGTAVVITVAGACLIFVRVLSLRPGRRYLVYSACLMAAAMFAFYSVSEADFLHPEASPSVCAGLLTGPSGWTRFAAFWLLLAAAEGAVIVRLARIKSTMLTSNAVKESLDALPDGVCYFTGDGQPLLVNDRMNQLCGMLFDTEVLNAEQFWHGLTEKKWDDGTEVLCTSPTVTLRTRDKRVWDFRRNIPEKGSPGICEITAVDVTEQYLLNSELKKRNEMLDRINRRLRRYNSEIEHVIAEKELLAAKVQVHDDVGRALLAFRSTYLSQPPGERDRAGLLRLWRANVAVLKNEASFKREKNDRELLWQAAQAVDVDIVLDGELPENGNERKILLSAVHECLTNTVKHAGGHKLYVHIETFGPVIRAELSNDGNPPEKEIQETGGLLDLRRTVEASGGVMRIESAPRFLLHITLVKGGRTDGKNESNDRG